VGLAERLVVLAKESERPEGRRAAASGMVALAKELVGFNVTKEFEASTRETERLAIQFKDAHADLIREVNEAEKALKDKQDVLKAYYKDWATKSGYKTVRAELLGQAETCMAVGESLDGLADGMKLVKRESEQESYKEKYNVLVSMLNEAELKKFSRILNQFFNKQVTELKTGLKLLDDDVKEWHEGAQSIAEERGIKLPKASARTANVFEDVVEAIKEAIPRLVETVTGFFSGLLERVRVNGDELADLEGKIAAMVAKARAEGL
jgi:hypothetical protein